MNSSTKIVEEFTYHTDSIGFSSHPISLRVELVTGFHSSTVCFAITDLGADVEFARLLIDRDMRRFALPSLN